MEFKYVACEGTLGLAYRPIIPVTFTYRKRSIPIGHALVDTGADVTLLPLDVARHLEVELDEERKIRIESAAAETFWAYPSMERVECRVDAKGFPPLIWRATLYFALHQPTVLLGQKECLDRHRIVFDGKNRLLTIGA